MLVLFIIINYVQTKMPGFSTWVAIMYFSNYKTHLFLSAQALNTVIICGRSTIKSCQSSLVVTCQEGVDTWRKGCGKKTVHPPPSFTL